MDKLSVNSKMDICKKYANGNNYVTMDSLAIEYECSRSTISRIIHFGIEKIYSENECERVKNKIFLLSAISAKGREIVPESVWHSFNESYQNRSNKPISPNNIEYLQQRLKELNFQISTFNSSISSSEISEGFTIESLLSEKEQIEKELAL